MSWTGQYGLDTIVVGIQQYEGNITKISVSHWYAGWDLKITSGLMFLVCLDSETFVVARQKEDSVKTDVYSGSTAVVYRASLPVNRCRKV